MNEMESCPVCGDGHTVACVTEEEQQIDQFTCRVKVHARQCAVCATVFAGALESRLNKREMVGLKKRALGLLSGKRVKEIRLKYRLTIAQADQVFGGGPVAFSKYENDDLCQSLQMDKLLLGAERFPDFFADLCRESGLIIDSVVTHPDARSVKKASVSPSDDIDWGAAHYHPKIFRKTEEVDVQRAR